MPVVTRDEFGLRTSDPRSETLRQARLHVASFNSTWAGGVWSSRKTVVSVFVNLISDHENVFETPLNGVGTDGSWGDWIMGGIGGWGTLRNVITALKSIAKHYKPGDKIILNGYSRGAWAARCLALLIYVVGLPKDGDEKLFHRLYKACDNNSIWDEGVAEKILEGYHCWNDVKINALCCFDTVGSLGWPLTGIAKPLAILRGWKKKHDIVSDVAPNVEFSFHALSLHERREPFAPTLMRGNNVYQVSFPGGHGNLGWIEDTESLVHGPLAWMIQQVHKHLGISFDEEKLAARFPSYYPGGVDTPTDPTWFNGDIEHINSTILAIIGKKARKPGRINSANGSTDLKVHIGARLRNDVDQSAVPGYTLMAPMTGRPYWAQRLQRNKHSWRKNSDETSSSSGSGSSGPRRATRTWSPNAVSKAADRIEEAPVGPLEARLLGLPQSIVTP